MAIVDLPEAIAFATIAAAMSGGNSYIFVQFFPRSGGTPNLGRAVLVAGLLGSMLSIWLAVLWAVIDPSLGSYLSVFLAMNAMMVALGVWFISVMMRAEEHDVAFGSWSWSTTLALLIVGNELFMGTSFVGALQGPGAVIANGGPTLVSAFAASVNSLWFFYAMFANMAWLVLWVRIPRETRILVLLLASTALVGPWVVWAPIAGAAGMAAIMVATLGYALHQVRSDQGRSTGFLRSVLGVSAGFAVMGAGALAVLVAPNSSEGVPLWALASFSVMLTELLVTVRLALRVPRAAVPTPQLGPSEENSRISGAPETPVAPS